MAQNSYQVQEWAADDLRWKIRFEYWFSIFEKTKIYTHSSHVPGSIRCRTEPSRNTRKRFTPATSAASPSLESPRLTWDPWSTEIFKTKNANFSNFEMLAILISATIRGPNWPAQVHLSTRVVNGMLFWKFCRLQVPTNLVNCMMNWWCKHFLHDVREMSNSNPLCSAVYLETHSGFRFQFPITGNKYKRGSVPTIQLSRHNTRVRIRKIRRFSFPWLDYLNILTLVTLTIK